MMLPVLCLSVFLSKQILNIELKQWEVIFGSFVAIYLFQRTLVVILTGGVGKNGSSVAVSFHLRNIP